MHSERALSIAPKSQYSQLRVATREGPRRDTKNLALPIACWIRLSTMSLSFVKGLPLTGNDLFVLPAHLINPIFFVTTDVLSRHLYLDSDETDM